LNRSAKDAQLEPRAGFESATCRSPEKFTRRPLSSPLFRGKVALAEFPG